MIFAEEAKKVMARFFLSLALLLSSANVFADEIKIPFPIYINDFKKDAKEIGFDFYGNKDSIGFIEDNAGEFVIKTYRSFPVKDLDTITKLTWKNLRK